MMMYTLGSGLVKWLALFVLCAMCALGSAIAAEQASPMVVIHGDPSADIAPQAAYRAELYKLLLESTRAEFGDYRLSSYYAAEAAHRQAILLGASDLLNIHFGSPGTSIATANVIKIPVDIQHGLLGYRVCLTTSQNRAPWAAVLDTKTLSAVRIGQVDVWPDSNIYKVNQANLFGTPSFDGLFAMLSVNRFDCLPLGVNEVGTIYRDKKVKYPNLRIEETLLIYYDFPSYIYVSAKRPDIAKRLSRGFEIIQKNGQFEQLYQRYIAQDLAALNLPARRIICLKSPYSTSAEQCSKPTPLPAVIAKESR